MWLCVTPVKQIQYPAIMETGVFPFPKEYLISHCPACTKQCAVEFYPLIGDFLRITVLVADPLNL